MPNSAVHTTVSPGSIGGLFARKTVQDGTSWDYKRNWGIDISIDGTDFRDDHMKHGDTPVFVGAFTRDYAFTAKEVLPNDSQDYETSWKVIAKVVEDGKVVEKEISSGPGPTTSGIIYPQTIIEYVNKRKWIDHLLTVKKIVLNQDDPQELQRDWKITLELYDGKSDQKAPITGLAVPAGAQNWTEIGGGKYTFTLKHQESLQIRLPRNCLYSVVEDEYPGYFTLYENQQGSLSDETVATVKNIPNPDITVKKENDKGGFVPGARFKLMRKNEEGRYIQFEPPLGEYKLIETKAPDGHIILSEGYEFILKHDENGKPFIDPVTQMEDVTVDNETLTIAVKNRPGKELPDTGGPGTLLYTLGGIALIMMTALMYGFRTKRRERRLN